MKFQSGCPADSSVRVFYNGDKDKVQFKVQMFGFRSERTSVYLHCVVRVCGQNCKKVLTSITMLRKAYRIPQIIR